MVPWHGTMTFPQMSLICVLMSSRSSLTEQLGQFVNRFGQVIRWCSCANMLTTSLIKMKHSTHLEVLFHQRGVTVFAAYRVVQTSLVEILLRDVEPAVV